MRSQEYDISLVLFPTGSCDPFYIEKWIAIFKPNN